MYRVLDVPVYNCVSMSLTETITKMENVTASDLSGEWAVYLRLTEGHWVQVQNFWFDGVSATIACEFDIPLSFDAYCCGRLASTSQKCTYWNDEILDDIFVVEFLE